MQTSTKALALATALILTGCTGLSLDSVLDSTAGGAVAGGLDRDTVVAGLKQALEIGTERTVSRTATLDGFLGNELIRIAMPPELETMTNTLRKLGLRRQVEELELAMNRAAEEAAGEAREILWTEIRALSFPDAMAILRGGDNAATDYLEDRTAADIRVEFHPIVVRKMEKVGLASLYEDLAASYNAIPFVTRTAVDLDDYVTDRALSGLFTVLGDEERKIREEPLARTTELLRRVFG